MSSSAGNSEEWLCSQSSVLCWSHWLLRSNRSRKLRLLWRSEQRGLATRERRSDHNHRPRRLRRSPDALSEAMAGTNEHCLHEPHHRVVRWLASGLRHSHARWSEVREGLPYSGERLSSAQRVCDCPHV